MKRLLVIQNIEREGPGLFSILAERIGFYSKIYCLSRGDKLPEARKDDLILIMGGPMGVSDINNKKYPWLKAEIKFIKKAIDNQISIIGVCLGAQLLAYAEGGNIEKMKDEFNQKYKAEIGWSEISSINLKNYDEISVFLKKPLNVLHWHGDRIILPSNAVLLASSKHCKEQLFKIGNNIYGLQFHAETDDLMTSNWIKNDKEFIISALGENGSKILKSQCQKFEKNSLNMRIVFINKLLKKIIEQ
tara:strand:+ start:938 stop:1675 length:738 start_codon:yes stop_codon:yes gene_type:complete